MSQSSKPRPKSDTKKYYKPKKSNAAGSNRSGQKSFKGRPSHNRKRARPVATFDPSLFIKKVEEQTAAQIYVPKHKFTDFLIDPQLKNNIINKGYVTPTPIQDQAIPFLLEGKDIIATANTGTGKTAAFLIPLINNILTKKTDRVLIIAPTRELAAQINDELKTFKVGMRFVSALCIGGVNIVAQIRALKTYPAFVIGTPGRLLDLEQQGALDFSKFTSIVLDEVDRMLDMGFINDIQHIVRRLPKKRHSLFFSATLPATLSKVMATFLHDPVSVSVKTRQTAENVNQDIIRVSHSTKLDTLHDLLIKPEFKKIIIFVRTKRSADKLARSLQERGFSVAVIHGDKTQSQRSKALSLFKKDAVKILLATDVVARGIDIDDVTHVINYDLPQTYEDYIHRIGRTGRAQKVGQAITFVE